VLGRSVKNYCSTEFKRIVKARGIVQSPEQGCTLFLFRGLAVIDRFQVFHLRLSISTPVQRDFALVGFTKFLKGPKQQPLEMVFAAA